MLSLTIDARSSSGSSRVAWRVAVEREREAGVDRLLERADQLGVDGLVLDQLEHGAAGREREGAHREHEVARDVDVGGRSPTSESRPRSENAPANTPAVIASGVAGPSASCTGR